MPSMRTSTAPTPSGGTPRASTQKKSRDSMTTATARATTRTRKPDRESRCGDGVQPRDRVAAQDVRTAREPPVMWEGGQVEVDAAGSGEGRARLLQALDLADDLVDVVAGARVHVHGVVAQRAHVVQIRALVRARELGRVDPQLARPADDLVVHVGDVLHEEAGEEVEVGVGLGVAEVREGVDRRPADEQPDLA